MAALGFSKLRDIDPTKLGESLPMIARSIWNWFGNHGCFIGGMPFTPDYTPHGLTDPTLTPFERLYFVQGISTLDNPLIAVRMKKRAKNPNRGKLHNPMGHLPGDGEYEAESVIIYDLRSKEMVPEPKTDMGEAKFLEEYPRALRLV